MENGAPRTRLASHASTSPQRDAFRDLCPPPRHVAPHRWGAHRYVKAPRRGGSCERGEICHRQPAACWRGGRLVTQPAEGVARRLLAPARAQWAKAARHPQTEHPALSLPRRRLRWPQLTLGARARLRRELAGRGFRVYCRNVS